MVWNLSPRGPRACLPRRRVARVPPTPHVDTAARHREHVKLRREWGAVTALTALLWQGLLIVGTRSGVAAAYDVRQNYEMVHKYEFNAAVVAIASLHALFVVATDNKRIVVIDQFHPEEQQELETKFHVTAVAVDEEVIVAAGDGLVRYSSESTEERTRPHSQTLEPQDPAAVVAEPPGGPVPPRAYFWGPGRWRRGR